MIWSRTLSRLNHTEKFQMLVPLFLQVACYSDALGHARPPIMQGTIVHYTLSSIISWWHFNYTSIILSCALTQVNESLPETMVLKAAV
jgi:hypothetical protein